MHSNRPWNDTALTRLLGIEYPIVQGPFGGGLSSVALASTVSNAGGLGSYGAQGNKPEEIGPLVRELRAATDRPFAVNLWVSDRDPVVDSVTGDEFDRWTSALQPLFDELGVERPRFSPPFGPRFE
ncbi:MAG: nitronate monooxygenase, partial [Candidatus Eremiobacteraeota bacterium]|nr:nitronate monooxygenase [Candidatus Eremiobacteraeota bacterium]